MSRFFRLSPLPIFEILIYYFIYNFNKLFIASSRLLAAKVQKPAPDFAGTAVVNNDFKEIKLADFKGKYLVSGKCFVAQSIAKCFSF